MALQGQNEFSLEGGRTVEHVGVLFAPFYFTWDAFWVAVVLYWMTFHLGLSLGYHRYLSHKSFKVPLFLEYFLAYCGVQGGQGDPIFWASVHRHHHQYTDNHRDPHSPIEGFWFSHISWTLDHTYVKEKPNSVNEIYVQCGEPNNVMDLQKHAFYRFIQRTYFYHLIGLGLFLYMIGGLPYILWGMCTRMAWGHHSTFIVNSVCHKWGTKTWNTKDDSRNNFIIGMLVGEGWHNNHHAFEFSARVGLEWWQFDPQWYVVKLLEYIGLATDVKEPTEIQKLKMSFKYDKHGSQSFDQVLNEAS
ncbi:hypothetical protein C5167_046465 [Papaver somniferum]|uniref:Fatty acid desaturase domain-containing protein n=1 Tax=Papaver somniferum TaxID=3469 RepID=A0A4Y7LGL1_PAPSO|nr:hypothetical protein C5167_046465 [Papaver somniferum]